MGTENHLSKSDLDSWKKISGDVVPFFEDVSRSSLITSLTIVKEFSGPNNNLARHLDSAQASIEVCQFKGHAAVSIQGKGGQKISVKTAEIKELVIENSDGFVLAPALIAERIQAEGVEPVLVIPWVIQSLFSDFDIATMNYRNQLWELENNDVYPYSGLVADKKMVFQSIHDVTEHAAGIKAHGWESAAALAKEVRAAMLRYFCAGPQGNIPSHVVPFAIGVLLDHLTQQASYGCKGRMAVIRALLKALEQLQIRPYKKWILSRLPMSLDRLVDLANEPGIENKPDKIAQSVNAFLTDLYRCSQRVA